MEENTNEKDIVVDNTNTKKSKLSLISLILGALYLVYLIYYFSTAGSSTTDSYEAIGAGIATILVMPHMVAVFIAVIFNALGYFMNKRAFILVGAILYAVSIVLFFPYFMFVIIQTVLSFIAFAKMPKKIS